MAAGRRRAMQTLAVGWLGLLLLPLIGAWLAESLRRGARKAS